MHPGTSTPIRTRPIPPRYDEYRELYLGLGTAVAYLAGVWLGLQMTLASAPTSPLWPPNAILLAALLLTPPRRWWVPILAVLPAHFGAEIALGVPLTMAACWYVSNITEALLGAALVVRYLGHAPRFDRVRDLLAFMIAAGIVGPALSSFLDVAFVALVGWRYSEFWYLWRSRTLANSLAALTIVPLLLAPLAAGWRRLRRPRPSEILEIAALFGGLCMVAALVFTHAHPQPSAAWLAAPMPFFLWAALRRGVGSVSLCIALTALFAIEGVIGGRGPFVGNTAEAAVRAVQIYLLIACPSMMLLAASLRELREAKATAERQTQSLEFALEAGRMRMWEWDTMNQLSIQTRGGARVHSLYEFLERVHPDDRHIVATAMTAVAESGRTGEMEFRVRSGEGPTRWISGRGKMLRGSAGGLRRVIGVCSDTTPRKAQDVQLGAQREQIARLNRVALLGALSAAVAHELKQPLAAILSNAQAARRALGAADPRLKDVQEILSDIVTEDRRTIAVLERLRSLFTRDGPRSSEAAAANASVSDVLVLERSTLHARGVATHLELAADLPLVALERIELQQVLINLISNACDAVQENASGDRHISIVTLGQDGGVAIDVRDNGPGLADTESIFGTFFTTKPEGLGLGLSICRAIIAARGGKLTARNNETAGATFRVWLPAFTPPGQPHRTPQTNATGDPPRDGHGGTNSANHATVPEHLLNAQPKRPGAGNSAVGPHV